MIYASAAFQLSECGRILLAVDDLPWQSTNRLAVNLQCASEPVQLVHRRRASIDRHRVHIFIKFSALRPFPKFCFYQTHRQAGVTSAIERITDACQTAGMRMGYFGVTAGAIRPFIERGYTLIAASVDTLFLGGAAKKMLADIR